MHVFSFPCPHCSTILRLKDRMFVGRRIGCPDCGRPIVIVSEGHKGISAQKDDSAHSSAERGSHNSARSSPPNAANERKAAPGRTDGSIAEAAPAAAVTHQSRAAPAAGLALADPRRLNLPTWGAALKSPVGIAWTTAGGAALLFLVAVWPFGERSSNEDRQSAVAAVPQVDDPPSAVIDANEAAGDPLVPVVADGANVADPPEAKIAAAQTQLERLGRRLADFHQRRQHFPAGTVYGDGIAPTERLSWLATLMAETEQQAALRPLWDRAWDDPLNDRFVRRGIPDLQNPAVKRLADPNRYPATHYVGIAGVGVDAAELPVDHPRAGIFGTDRRTKLSDIKDGTANTMMVAGVNDNPGAWAAGGQATIRALTREPYVNGPDRLGTGETEGMYVLMADGSVRFVSKNTEPAILRRMAAMADGLPLDPNVPGEPGEPRPNPASAPGPAGLPVAQRDDPPDQGGNAPKADDAPIPLKNAQPLQGNDPPKPAASPPNEEAAEKAPAADPEPAPKLDLEAALAQRIVRFEQSRAVPLQELLFQVEEMAAVPIRVDKEQLGPAAAALDKPVSLKLENTSVGELLKALVEPAGLAYELDTGGIRILRAE